MGKKYFPEKISGNRIYLKKRTVSDAQILFDLIEGDRKRLKSFLPWVNYILSKEDELKHINETANLWTDCMDFTFGIYLNHTNQIIGCINVHTIRWEHERCELGYWISGEHEGNGFVSESVTLLENKCFELGFHRIEIRCSSENNKSANIPRRLNYSLDGTLIEDSIENGKFRNTLVFGKINHT